MAGVLSVIGLLCCIVCIIWLIVFAIKRESKKAPIICFVISLAMFIGGGIMLSNADTEKANNGQIKSGTYTLPCGMKIDFYSSVENDVTGKWRRTATSDSYVPADYALEYYNEMFSSNDEIHSIWNATLKTTTRIFVSNNMLFVDTFEYSKGEEHDAKIMFSGMLLDSKIIDINSGKEIE